MIKNWWAGYLFEVDPDLKLTLDFLVLLSSLQIRVDPDLNLTLDFPVLLSILLNLQV
jgi:hypothetical protein